MQRCHLCGKLIKKVVNSEYLYSTFLTLIRAQSALGADQTQWHLPNDTLTARRELNLQPSHHVDWSSFASKPPKLDYFNEEHSFFYVELFIFKKEDIFHYSFGFSMNEPKHNFNNYFDLTNSFLSLLIDIIK